MQGKSLYDFPIHLGLGVAFAQDLDRQLWRRHITYLEKFLKKESHADEAERLGIGDRLRLANQTLRDIESPAYRQRLVGTLGVEPISPGRSGGC